MNKEKKGFYVVSEGSIYRNGRIRPQQWYHKPLTEKEYEFLMDYLDRYYESINQQ